MTEPYRTRHVLGEDNILVFGLDVHRWVFFCSAAAVSLMVGWVVLFPAAATQGFAAALAFLTTQAGGFMALLANLFVLFCLFLVVSPYGSVRLGGADARPVFSDLSWFAMLFAAGMGIGLMFYGVSEPISHFSSSLAEGAGSPDSWAPLAGAAGDTEGARRLGMAATIFHWTVHPWSIFAVVAVGLALFTYNHGLPLTIRSSLFPLFGERIWGPLGNVVDILAVIATVAGLATSLGLGAQQALAGLGYLFGAEPSTLNQLLLIGILASITVMSVTLGLTRGVRWLSLLNISLAALLCAFVIAVGPTAKIFTALWQDGLAFIAAFPALSSMADREDAPFFRDWTIFYWAWWTAWAPFVGMFIARISRGRTVRQTVFFVVMLPSLVSVVWFTAFGTLAIDQLVVGGSRAAADAYLPLKLFATLRELPLAQISSLVGIVLVMVFFVTSWDSGTLVLDGLSVMTHRFLLRSGR